MKLKNVACRSRLKLTKINLEIENKGERNKKKEIKKIELEVIILINGIYYKWSFVLSSVFLSQNANPLETSITLSEATL